MNHERKVNIMAILQVDQLSYAYKDSEHNVLTDLHIAFEQGLFYAIVGASGSGKTTLLSLLAGLDKPKEGIICVNGEDIQKKGLYYHRKHHVSLVFQNYNLIDYMTATENVLLGGGEHPEEILQDVGIQKHEMNRNVMKLSGGQQQRVAIARALASDTPILLADEPTGNLDEDTAQEIINLLSRNAHSRNKCVIVVTHSTELAEAADIVLKIHKGCITYTDNRSVIEER